MFCKDIFRWTYCVHPLDTVLMSFIDPWWWKPINLTHQMQVLSKNLGKWLDKPQCQSPTFRPIRSLFYLNNLQLLKIFVAKEMREDSLSSLYMKAVLIWLIGKPMMKMYKYKEFISTTLVQTVRIPSLCNVNPCAIGTVGLPLFFCSLAALRLAFLWFLSCWPHFYSPLSFPVSILRQWGHAALVSTCHPK